MANVVYVGNYPTTFTEDDILNIFQDFEGLVLLRSIKKDKKCYSFILCQDQEQVLELVLTMNETDVGGRNLIVRASDDELQEIIEEADLDEEYFEEEEEDFDYNQQEDCSNTDYNSFRLDTNSPRCYRQPRNPSRLVPFNETSSTVSKESQVVNDLPFSPNYKSNHSSGVKQSSRYAHTVKGDGRTVDSSLGYRGSRHSRNPENKDFDDIETASFASYATSVRSGNTSPCSTTSSRFSSKGRCEKFSFISVANFRNGTTVEELQELFADYNPCKITIKCPTSGAGRPPTEAIVCFLKSKDATDSILNLDNTLHKGRVLIVTECDDISEISELMKVHSRKR